MTEAYAEQMTQAQSIRNPYFVGQCQKVTGAQLLDSAKSYWVGTMIFMLDRAVHPLQLELLLHTGLARMRYSQESVYE